MVPAETKIISSSPLLSSLGRGPCRLDELSMVDT